MVLNQIFKIITSKHAILSWNFFAIDQPLKQNEWVLSSQALNVERSLGIGSNMAKLKFDSDVRGCHAHL